MEGTEEHKEDNPNVWTASRPTNRDKNGAATGSKLNSNCTKGPTQNQLQDKTSTKSWHKTNTELAIDKVQTEIAEPDNDKGAAGTDTVRKDVTSDKPVHDFPKVVATTIVEVDNLSNELLTIISEFEKPPTRPHIIDVEDEDTCEEETDEPPTIMSKFKKPPPGLT